MNVQRYLRAFSKSNDLLAWALPLDRFVLSEFQAEFNVAEHDDPMYDCYPVTEANVPFLSRYISNHYGWDFDEYSYFIEANAA